MYNLIRRKNFNGLGTRGREKSKKVGRKIVTVGRKPLFLQKFTMMKSKLEELVGRYRTLGIDRQLDYGKFYHERDYDTPFEQ